MSTDQLSPRHAPPSAGQTKLVQYDEYIDTKVESTRRLVKIVDLSTSLVLLAAGVIAYLMVAAVAEHWLVPGGYSSAARIALFVLLAGGVLYFAYRRLWPLLVRRVNPVYAAQTIETAAASGTSLKNSLINLLLFRQKRSEISDAVYQTLEEQAAQRLSRVPVDAAVDRSLLIRFGYVLVAVVAVAALYKVLSPKDPLVAARRLLMPWADIVPASRVSIRAIEPGSVTLSRGDHVDVSAEIRGIGDTDAVILRFTTEDTQAVDKSVVMKPSSDGLRYEGRLPDAADSTREVGLSQNLAYRIEAGDARSLNYAVKVVAAPSILVERVEYDYPEYTGYVDRHVDGLGDLRAIEGTRVTITARANGTIKEAHVDFDADGRRDLNMTSSGESTHASFVLSLREDRQTPAHASYVLRFTNTEGQTNRKPVKHSIGVEPDYAPEAAIRLPKDKLLDVRLDETLAIEVEARDPDFALSEVRLRGEVAGREVFNERLLEGKESGRFTSRYAFTAGAHDLKAGDVVEYWVTANDNRTPKPNSATSERKQLRIVSPDPAQPPPDRIAQRDPQQRQQPGQEQQQEGAGGQGEQQGEQQQGGASGQGQQGDNQEQQDGQQGQQGGEQQVGRDAQGSDGQGQGDKETGKQGESSGQGGTEGDAAQANDQSGGENQPGAQGQQSSQQSKPGEQISSGKQTGAGAAGGEPSQGSQPAGTRPDGNSGQSSKNGDRQSGDQKPPNAEQSPVSSEGDNDAEAFERIQRHMERNGQLGEGESMPKEGELGGEEGQGQGDKETGRQGEAEAKDGSPDEGAREGREQTGERANDRGEAGTGQPDKAGAGAGAETKGDDLQQAKEQPGEQRDENKSPGGQHTSTKGPAGAGDEQKPQGSPNSQPEMKPADKRPQSPSQGEQSNKQEPPAGARGKRESDSQGDEGGDRAGGGEEGGGQKAPREGTGSAGQNQSADEGAGESSEQGAGNDSSSAGQEAAAKDRTGQTGGETSGRGSKQRGGQGEQPGGEQGHGDKETGRQGDSEATAEQDSTKHGEEPSERSGERNADGQRQPDNDAGRRDQGGTPTGSGGETGADGPPPRAEGTVPDGDEANLEYTRKQTDLVLDRLADQLNREKVDEKLLDDLGWSKEDLRKFVDRWNARKRAAEQNDQSGDAARRELDEALRSLGLRRGAMRQGQVKDDTLRDLREGYRGPVPLEYQERLRAYNQGVSRARQDER